MIIVIFQWPVDNRTEAGSRIDGKSKPIYCIHANQDTLHARL